MTILAIDYGKKRCGLAVEVEKIAIPLEIVETFKIIKELNKIIKQRNIKKIVIGEPKDLFLENQQILKKTIEFKEKLEKIFPEIEIFLIDERFTTKIVDNSKTKRDDLSACLILESFLDRIKKSTK